MLTVAQKEASHSWVRAGLQSDAPAPYSQAMASCSCSRSVLSFTGTLGIPGLHFPPVRPVLSKDCMVPGREGQSCSSGSLDLCISETLWILQSDMDIYKHSPALPWVKKHLFPLPGPHHFFSCCYPYMPLISQAQAQSA